MGDEDRATFGLAITAMLETFGQEATTPRLMGYWLALRDLDRAVVESVVTQALRTCKRLPVPAELRELCFGGRAADRAVEAWGDVLRAVPRGPYVHLDFADAAINATIRHLGGWVTFLDRFRTAEDEKWARIDFCRCYEVLASRELSGDVVRPLPGLSEATIFDGRISPPAVVRIGCSEQRRAIGQSCQQEKPALRLNVFKTAAYVTDGMTEAATC